MRRDMRRSAVIVVDMQNDFISPGGYSARMGQRPERAEQRKSSEPLIAQAVANIGRLAKAARAAGRPVVYIQHVLREDYADACFPYWRLPNCIEEKFLVEGTWGAQIIDQLKPEPGDMVITKKGFSAFMKTPLDTYLRNLGVTTCIMTGVATCVCVESSTRHGVELNYYMVVVNDATAAGKEAHEASLIAMGRVFADIITTEEVVTLLQTLPLPKAATIRSQK